MKFTLGWIACSQRPSCEEELPIKHESVDAVISVLGLHWANDLPGAMAGGSLRTTTRRRS